MLPHDLLDETPDFREWYDSIKKGLYSYFIRSIHYRRQRPTNRPRLPRKPQGGKNLLTGRFKIQTSQGCKVEGLKRMSNTMRPGHCILNRKTHICCTNLSQHAAINKFNHGMYDTLRVNHHLNSVHTHPKQPSSLNHLEPFVEHRRRIDGDLPAHLPGGMLERLLRSNLI